MKTSSGVPEKRPAKPRARHRLKTSHLREGVWAGDGLENASQGWRCGFLGWVVAMLAPSSCSASAPSGAAAMCSSCYPISLMFHLARI